MTADSDNVLMIIDLSESITEAAYQGVDRLFRDAEPLGVWPHDVDDLVSTADGAVSLGQQFQKSELGQRQRGTQLLSDDPDLSPVTVNDQAAGHSGGIHAQRNGCLGADKKEFHTEGDLDLITVLQRAASNEWRSIEPSPVLTPQVLDREPITLIINPDMVTRDRSFAQRDFAISGPTDGQYIRFEWPPLSGHLAFVHDQNRDFAHFHGEFSLC